MQRRVLLVLSDPDQLEWLRHALAARDVDVACDRTRADAIDRILLASHLDFVVVGTKLSDGPGLDVARTATLMLPTPHVLFVNDELSVEDAFTAASLGVHSLLKPPLSAESLIAAFERAEREAPPPIYALLARYVGRVSLLAFEREVRRSLLIQALDKTGGSRSAAARLLGISRQLVQKAANGDDD